MTPQYLGIDSAHLIKKKLIWICVRKCVDLLIGIWFFYYNDYYQERFDQLNLELTCYYLDLACCCTKGHFQTNLIFSHSCFK